MSAWSNKKEQALALLFEGGRTKQQIADEVGVSWYTISDWVREDEFKRRLEEMRARFREHLEGTAFVNREQRILALSQLAQDALGEWRDRRYLVEVRPVPGGMLTNERLNTDAAELARGALSDIAKELGERSTKVDMKAQVEHELIQVTVMDLPPEITTRYLRAGPIVDADSDDDDDA